MLHKVLHTSLYMKIKYQYLPIYYTIQHPASPDCNSAEATHAWFDSKIAHHILRKRGLRPAFCISDQGVNTAARKYSAGSAVPSS